MKRAWADASRVEAVRTAALGWQKAGAVGHGTLAAIWVEYPDSRIALHRVLRVLAFVLVSMAIVAVFFGLFRSSSGLFGPSLVFAILLAGATEALRGSGLSGTGTDAATSYWAVWFLIGSIGSFLSDRLNVESDMEATLLLGAAALAGALVFWRWGFWFFAGAGAAGLYLCVARLPAGRAAWLVIPILAMASTYRAFDRTSIAPAHRRGLQAVFAVSAAALYAAVNLYGLDESLFERLRHSPFAGSLKSEAAPAALRAVSGLSTAAFPAVFLAWGIRARRSLLLMIGITAAALSVATLRHYAPIGPRWAFLTACGAVLVLSALWIQRRLRSFPRAAWRGLTAAPLYADSEGGVSPLAALGAHLVSPAAPATPERGGFSGGGGQYGGGGASGEF